MTSSSTEAVLPSKPNILTLTSSVLFNQVELLKKCIKNFFGDSLQNLRNLCRIVNKHHFDRVCNLLKDPGVSASIVYGGSFDEENL